MIDYSPNNRMRPFYLKSYKSIIWTIIDRFYFSWILKDQDRPVTRPRSRSETQNLGIDSYESYKSIRDGGLRDNP